MVEAEGLQGQFAGWSRPAADIKMLMLAAIIAKYKPVSIHASVDTEACARILAGTVPIGFARPYGICFQAIIIHLAKYHQEIGVTVPVDFIFDEQGGIGDEAAIQYDWVKKTMPPEISARMGARPIFRDDKLVVPLQAADMLAWHIRRWREGIDTFETRPALHLLTPTGKHIGVDVGEDYLKEMAKNIQRIPGTKELLEKKNWLQAKREMADWIAAGDAPLPDISHWQMRLKYGKRAVRRSLRDLYQRVRRAWKELTRG